MPRFNELPIGEDAPDAVNAVIEIPKGSKNKYEYSPELDVFALDRVLPGPLRFPAAYGFVPQTVAPDGDELDILVIQDEPVAMAVMVAARPLAKLRMTWTGADKVDEKIVSVSLNDPRYRDYRALDALPEHYMAEIDYFFRSYLDLTDPGIVTEWADASAARDVVRSAHESWRTSRG